MKDILNNSKDFKIIPSNFKSSGILQIIEISNDEIKAKLELLDKNELNDYIVNSKVEIFAINQTGLLYFETSILSKDGENITLKTSQDYSIIQRREYSRVNLGKGNVVFKDISPESILNIEDISAGGLKLISSTPLEIDKYYDIEITLSNNMKIECAFSPIRLEETLHNNQKAYSISGKFVNLENADRIILVQYTFKIKMEEQNKEAN